MRPTTCIRQVCRAARSLSPFIAATMRRAAGDDTATPQLAQLVTGRHSAATELFARPDLAVAVAVAAAVATARCVAPTLRTCRPYVFCAIRWRGSGGMFGADAELRAMCRWSGCGMGTGEGVGGLWRGRRLTPLLRLGCMQEGCAHPAISGLENCSTFASVACCHGLPSADGRVEPSHDS